MQTMQGIGASGFREMGCGVAENAPRDVPRRTLQTLRVIGNGVFRGWRGFDDIDDGGGGTFWRVGSEDNRR